MFIICMCIASCLCLFTAGLGCNFVTANCDSWPYSCPTPGVDGCSYDYQATVRTYIQPQKLEVLIACCKFVMFPQSRCASSDPDYYDGCLHFIPNPTGYCNSFQGMFLFQIPCIYIYLFADTITNICFPLMPSTGDVSSSCYGRQCYRHSSTQELFYTVTIPGQFSVLRCMWLSNFLCI